ncbi:MAG: hydrolase, partial [Alphaproteobacteria bacterium]
VLLIVDIQEKFVPAIHDFNHMLRNGILLMGAAARLDVPMLMSEQYPQGLGRTIPDLATLYTGGKPFEKTCFSCSEEPGFLPKLAEFQSKQVVLIGIETHVCILQTALGLRAAGYDAFVVADAVSSRTPKNHELGLARARDNGVEIVSAEMVLFEWLHRSVTDEFRELSKLVR